MHTFTAPPLLNFHENRKIESGWSKNIEELKLASNRFKRYLAIKSLLTYKYSDFLNFKYPKFSTIFLFYISLFLVFFSIYDLIFSLVVMFLLYFNPFLKPKIDKILFEHFFGEGHINKDYI